MLFVGPIELISLFDTFEELCGWSVEISSALSSLDVKLEKDRLLVFDFGSFAPLSSASVEKLLIRKELRAIISKGEQQVSR